jgi:hypothetical protein
MEECWLTKPYEFHNSVLDLEVTLMGVVRFLSPCESKGIQLLHCPAVMREWIAREQETQK